MMLKSPGGKRRWEEAKLWYMHRDHLDKLILERSELAALIEVSMFKLDGDK
jgi:hypothetical protein